MKKNAEGMYSFAKELFTKIKTMMSRASARN